MKGKRERTSEEQGGGGEEEENVHRIATLLFEWSLRIRRSGYYGNTDNDGAK
jgi:hypothetical protein